jgi:Mn2+/Fe2+ NRAMP family transporter
LGDEDRFGEATPRDKQRLKSFVVVLGIALFIVGFLITVSVLSGSGEANQQNATGSSLATEPHARPGPFDAFVLLGMAVSFSGIVIATVGPMASFIQARAR